MDRLNLNQADIDRHRTAISELEVGLSTPCPGSLLKLDDDVLWLGFVSGRVVWGHPNDACFYCYAPEIFGDSLAPLDIGYVNDRAPADPQETPMPLYPEP